MANLTKAQRTRLDKLATYLEGLPEDYLHFGMRRWIFDASWSAEVKYARENGGVASCGTAACAAGHGPAAGILVPPRFIREDNEVPVNWSDYAEWLAGPACDWCFDGDWSWIDNSHYGAAARIRYLLADNPVPYEFTGGIFLGPRLRHVDLYAPYRIDAKAKADA